MGYGREVYPGRYGREVYPGVYAGIPMVAILPGVYTLLYPHGYTRCTSCYQCTTYCTPCCGTTMPWALTGNNPWVESLPSLSGP